MLAIHLIDFNCNLTQILWAARCCTFIFFSAANIRDPAGFRFYLTHFSCICNVSEKLNFFSVIFTPEIKATSKSEIDILGGEKNVF